VEYTVEVVQPVGQAVAVGVVVVTGQTVVEMAMVWVTTAVPQLLVPGTHDVVVSQTVV